MANLLLNPEAMDGATWTANISSVSADATTAPDGTLTADLLIPNTSSSRDHRLTHDATALSGSTQYTMSAFVKDGGYQYAGIAFAGAAFAGEVAALFDLSSGTVVDTDDGTSISVDSTAIEDYGDGWYRISLTVTTAGAGNVLPRLYPADISTLNTGGLGTDLFAGDGSSGVYYWGVYLNEGATAETYVSVGGTTVEPASAGMEVGDDDWWRRRRIMQQHSRKRR